MIDDCGGAMRSAGLITRRRIGMEIFTLIQPKAVARARAHFGCTGKIAIGLRCQRLKAAVRARIDIFLENQIDSARFRRPDTKMGPARRDNFGANRIAPGQRRLIHALNSSISRETVVVHLLSGSPMTEVTNKKMKQILGREKGNKSASRLLFSAIRVR